jgi:ABC-type glycerol-3-phosphate transport system substrate-binding protein
VYFIYIYNQLKHIYKQKQTFIMKKILSLALVVALASCGGSDSATSTTDSTVVTPVDTTVKPVTDTVTVNQEVKPVADAEKPVDVNAIK